VRSNSNTRNNNDAGMTLTVELDAGSPIGAAELKALIESTNKANPTKEDRAALAAAFDKLPELTAIMGNIMRNLRKNKIKKLSESHFFQESASRTLDRIERELGYEGAPMASKLLIEQVLLCWADLAEVQAFHNLCMERSHSLSEGKYWDERLTRAQARYLRALETLAKVNRLFKVVPVQVNIAAQGGQQVNIAKGDG
jgi:hypothetical protein